MQVTGSGKGGRNQEMALRFAALCETNPLPGDWAFLSGGTDGRDGPTDAAGGLVTARNDPGAGRKGPVGRDLSRRQRRLSRAEAKPARC